ncbi:MAG: hypothetical protein CSB34_04725 [Desulfobulbus propionicus]|nr:MAG: hypothetical protein CSB34_04725 [Desulfobulbus propionicus]
MSEQQLPPFIDALLQPAMYPHPAEDISLVQTHISFVLLAGEFVYKFKKPVDFGFLDFSTLEKRKVCCEQELSLNSRLCPDIYLDVVTVNQRHDTFAFGGDGTIVEYGIKMVRMPEEKMMGNLIKAGQLTKTHLDKIAATLVPFYHNAATGEEVNAYGNPEAVGVNVMENFEQTESFVGQGALGKEQFEYIRNYATAKLACCELFERRIAGGYIRDCHGDLHSVNICLPDDGVYIYDCIEFSKRLRFHDVACDVGFLAMDLDFYGLPELSTYFIEQFVQASGDSSLGEVLDFYKCYRAYVRGKIGLFTAADPVVAEAVQQECLASAAKYFELAYTYAQGDQ